jgi:hypothetical protein
MACIAATNVITAASQGSQVAARLSSTAPAREGATGLMAETADVAETLTWRRLKKDSLS